MKKSKADKRVVHDMKVLNRKIREDVFGDRFYVRMISKHGYFDWHQYHYYWFEFIDNECPERNETACYDQGEVLIGKKLWIKINDFIVNSDFWTKFNANTREKFFKDHAWCCTCDKYTKYRVKKELMTHYTENNEPITFAGYRMYCTECGKPSYIYDDLEDENLKIVQKTRPDIKELHSYIRTWDLGAELGVKKEEDV